MRTLVAFTLLAALAGATCAEDKVPGVIISMSMLSAEALEVSYQVPAGCTRLDFANVGIRTQAAVAMRQDWTPLDSCAKLDGDAVRINPSCSAVRLRVPAVERKLDRVFPWALPINSGIYSHTSAFAITDTCGASHWHFSSPAGAIVVDGVPGGERSVRVAGQGQSDYMPVVFLQQPLGAGPDRTLHVDPRISMPARTFLQETLSAINAGYTRELPLLDFPQPFVLAAVNSGDAPWHGDVAGRNTMRLMFPASLTKVEEGQMRFFLAHEIAHLLQPLRMEDRWNSESTMIKEGGAEFLAWQTNARHGWMDQDALARKLDGAINACLMAADDQSWKAMPQRGWGKIPYDCGLAFHVIGLGDSASRLPAALLLRNYYRDAGRRHVTDFAHALECGDSMRCQPKWLARVLGSDEPLAAIIAQFSAASGLLKPAGIWSREQIEPATRLALSKLMASDCHGEVSFYTNPDSVKIAPVRSCASLREGMEVIAAEGLPLFTDRAAGAALITACKTSGNTTLTLRGGLPLVLACDKSIGTEPVLYAVNLPLLLKRLQVKQAAGRRSESSRSQFIKD